MKKNITAAMIFAFSILFSFASVGLAKEKEQKETGFEIPNHVLDISKENTHPNETEDYEQIEPSDETKELLENAKVPIDNTDLIEMLNETNIKPSPIAIGYRGMVYLGRWPLNYASLETGVNWEYQSVNKNEMNNIDGDAAQQMNYIQQENKEVKGILTNKIADSETVRKMMIEKAEKKTELPLSYQVIIGKNTKKTNAYHIPAQKNGTLEAFSPAVNEKGEITFGEVYIQLKGAKKQLVIKNVTKQGIGAWIPVQDHVSFSFQVR
ncbi:YfkD family protein [Oceanobacillus sp. FSL H7-0719]|uniref:YfkD family protein n=1 Tax=Oceanobacillus sp. FSL H7-0719 TaxID=2954507 RepID=UPI0032503095